MDALIQEHMRFSEKLRAAGKAVIGEALRPEAEASRIRLKAGHRQVTDGPFTETKEALGGFLRHRVRFQGRGARVGQASPAPRRPLHRGTADLEDV